VLNRLGKTEAGGCQAIPCMTYTHFAFDATQVQAALAADAVPACNLIQERIAHLIVHHDRVTKVLETWVWRAQAKMLLRDSVLI